MGDITFSKLWNESLDFFKKNFVLLFSLGFIFSYLPNILSDISYYLRGINLTEFTPETMGVGEVIALLKGLLPNIIILSFLSTFLVISLIFVVSSKNKKISLGEVLNKSSGFYVKAILLSILMFFFLTILFLLFIIPGIIFLIYWIFAYYVLVVEDCSIMNAFKGSKKIVKGRWWEVFFKFTLISIIMWVINIIFSWISEVILSLVPNLSEITDIIISSIVLYFIPTLTFIFGAIFMMKYYLSLKGKK
jgi:hypothetical protein